MTTASDSQSAIRRVMYFSKETRVFSNDELFTMCASFAAKNSTRGITGLLLRVGNCFLQIIEGSSDVITELLPKLKADTRHGCFTVIADHCDDQRRFGQWSMKLIDLDSTYYVNIASVKELREQIEDMVAGAPNKTQVIKSLIVRVVERIRQAAPRPA